VTQNENPDSRGKKAGLKISTLLFWSPPCISPMKWILICLVCATGALAMSIDGREDVVRVVRETVLGAMHVTEHAFGRLQAFAISTDDLGLIDGEIKGLEDLVEDGQFGGTETGRIVMWASAQLTRSLVKRLAKCTTVEDVKREQPLITESHRTLADQGDEFLLLGTLANKLAFVYGHQMLRALAAETNTPPPPSSASE